MISSFMEQDAELIFEGLNDPKRGGRLRMGDPAIVDGVTVDTILFEGAEPGQQSKSFIQIGQKDHLVRRFQTPYAIQGEPERIITQTFTNVRANFTPSSSMFVFDAPAGARAVAPIKAAKSAPEAVVLISRMYAAYKALRSFSCTAQMGDVSPATGSEGEMPPLRSQSAVYQFQQPNKISFSRTSEHGTTQAVSDGKTLYAVTNEFKGGSEEWRAQPRYLKRSATSDIPWNDGRMMAQFGGLPSFGGNSGWMPELILGVNGMPADGDYGFQVGRPTVLNGEPVDVVFYEQQISSGGGISDGSKRMTTLWISQRDHLLRRVSDEAVWSKNRQKSISQYVETFTNIKANPVIPPSTFKFTPPANSIPVGTAEELLPPRPTL
jgi:outer membrane lipoprotein-sorting protein